MAFLSCKLLNVICHIYYSDSSDCLMGKSKVVTSQIPAKLAARPCSHGLWPREPQRRGWTKSKRDLAVSSSLPTLKSDLDLPFLYAVGLICLSFYKPALSVILECMVNVCVTDIHSNIVRYLTHYLLLQILDRMSVSTARWNVTNTFVQQSTFALHYERHLYHTVTSFLDS